LVVAHFTGLLPKGVYTMWVVPLDNTGNPIGEGSLGKSDGSQNSFRASASGEGQVSVLARGGALSEFGQIPGCFTDANFLLVLAYHIDGQTHGGEPGPFCDFSAPLAFVHFAH